MCVRVFPLYLFAVNYSSSTLVSCFCSRSMTRVNCGRPSLSVLFNLCLFFVAVCSTVQTWLFFAFRLPFPCCVTHYDDSCFLRLCLCMNTKKTTTPDYLTLRSSTSTLRTRPIALHMSMDEVSSITLFQASAAQNNSEQKIVGFMWMFRSFPRRLKLICFLHQQSGG